MWLPMVTQHRALHQTFIFEFRDRELRGAKALQSATDSLFQAIKICNRARHLDAAAMIAD
jgi:hypothetical protein